MSLLLDEVLLVELDDLVTAAFELIDEVKVEYRR